VHGHLIVLDPESGRSDIVIVLERPVLDTIGRLGLAGARVARAVFVNVRQRDEPRDIQIGGHIDAALFEGREEVIELVQRIAPQPHLARYAIHQPPLVVMDAHRVVAQPHQAFSEPVGQLAR